MQIEIEGAIVVAMDESVWDTGINPGELYIARRNTGWKLLECKKLMMTNQGNPDYVIPHDRQQYAFDAWESFKVIDIKEVT